MEQKREKINPDAQVDGAVSEILILKHEDLALVGGADEGSGLIHIPK